MKLLAIFVIFAVLVYVSADTLPAVYDGPTYELSKYILPWQMTENFLACQTRILSIIEQFY